MATHSRGARTWEQVQTKKDQAARFARNILKNEDKASFIESESVEAYAERKKIRIKNPGGTKNMKKVDDLKTAILESVAELDESDGSRTSMFACIDGARETLALAYGEDFESDLAEHLQEADDDDSDFEDSDDE
jgi:biopolymer transport protein ExbB/TolQ